MKIIEINSISLPWRPIEEMDTSKYVLVLVYQNGVIRLRTWQVLNERWRSCDGLFEPLSIYDECRNPTHFVDVEWLKGPDENYRD